MFTTIRLFMCVQVGKEGNPSKSGRPWVKLFEAIMAKVHDAIIDWYMSNGELGIKRKFLYMPKYKKVEEIKEKWRVQFIHSGWH